MHSSTTPSDSWFRGFGRLGPALGLLLAAASCGTYESTAYGPRRQVHEIRVQEEGESGESRLAAEVDARVLGILRATDSAQRRIHARLRIRNPGQRPLNLCIEQCRLVVAGVREIAPRSDLAEVGISPGESRSVDLLFDLPHAGDLPSSSLDELELSWVLDLDGQTHRSKATFQAGAQRSSGYARSSVGVGWYDPFWYDPYWGSPGWGYYGWGYRGYWGYPGPYCR